MTKLGYHHILVLGTGLSGHAAVRWCLYMGAQVRWVDQSADAKFDIDPKLHDDNLQCIQGSIDTPNLLDNIDLCVISPGYAADIPLVNYARQRHIEITNEIGLFIKALNKLKKRHDVVLIGITGTNGKTTATSLTCALCSAVEQSAVAAGNIGHPPLDILLQKIQAAEALPKYWILELSSFQLELCGVLALDAAAILNVTDDHLDRHATLENYAQIKARIFLGVQHSVLCRDNSLTASMLEIFPHAMSFGLDEAKQSQDWGIVVHHGQSYLAKGDQPLIAVQELQLTGQHNVLNVMASLALIEAVGIDIRKVLPALKQFRGLTHRVQIIAQRNDKVVFIDDSKGTNIGATEAALSGMQQPVVLIAGGEGKGQDFQQLRQQVKQHVRALVLIGKDAQHIGKVLQDDVSQIYYAIDMQQAVCQANDYAQAGDCVLLSPACSSLDMFSNYQQRGDIFRHHVLALVGVTEYV